MIKLYSTQSMNFRSDENMIWSANEQIIVRSIRNISFDAELLSLNTKNLSFIAGGLNISHLLFPLFVLLFFLRIPVMLFIITIQTFAFSLKYSFEFLLAQD